MNHRTGRIYKWISILLISSLLFSLANAVVAVEVEESSQTTSDSEALEKAEQIEVESSIDDEELTANLNRKPLVFNNLVFRGNSARHDAYFEVSKGERVVSGSYISLDYTYSASLLPEHSSLSIWVDDVPLAVIDLVHSELDTHKVNYDISKLRLEPGFHKISVIARMKLTDHACENPLHEGLWMVIYDSSFVHLNVEPLDEKFDLSWYPSPFVERGNRNPMKTILVVPDQLQQAEFNAASQLSQFFASQAEDNKLVIPIYTESDVTTKLLEEQHVIWIGQHDRWKNAGKRAVDALKGANNKQLDGVIAEVVSPWNPDKVNLFLSGNDAKLKTAATILSTEQLYIQMRGSMLEVPEALAAAERSDAEQVDGPYTITLEQLGYNDLKVESTLQGSTSFNYEIPAYSDLSGGTRLHLYYTHSNSVIYEKSVMTVRINGTPVDSVGLQEKTSGGGYLEIPIDPEIIGANRSLSVEIAFQFANLGTDEEVDREFNCADTLLGDWATISKGSGLTIVPVQREAEYLQSLPFPYVVGNRWSPTVMLAPQMGTVELQLAMTLIGKLGARIADSTDLEFELISSADWQTRAQDKHVIFIGTASTVPDSLNGYTGSYVQFVKDEIYSRSNHVQLLKTLHTNFAAIQLTPSPFNEDKRLLMLVSAATDRLMDIGKAFTDPKESGKISGRFVALDSDGIVFSFAGTQDPVSRTFVVAEDSGGERWNNFSISGYVYLILFLIILLSIALGVFWFTRKSSK